MACVRHTELRLCTMVWLYAVPGTAALRARPGVLCWRRKRREKAAAMFVWPAGMSLSLLGGRLSGPPRLCQLWPVTVSSERKRLPAGHLFTLFLFQKFLGVISQLFKAATITWPAINCYGHETTVASLCELDGTVVAEEHLFVY